MIGVSFLATLGLLLVGGTAQPPSAGTYRPPTDAAVADPYRPPPKPWMAGNRGIEYATEPGDEVRAIGAGRVAFAGSVAGRGVVAVAHPDGLRSMYSDVVDIAVPVGQVVEPGTLLARAEHHLHLGVRLGRTYLDPASLWGRTRPPGRPVLVPLDPGGERAPPRSPWALRGLVTTLDRRPAVR